MKSYRFLHPKPIGRISMCKCSGFLFGGADMLYSSTNTFISLSPPLCMQSGRYSLSGIHTVALLKHAVVGWGLHHADYEGVCGVSHTLLILRVLYIVTLYCLLYSPILLLRNERSERNRYLTGNLVNGYSYSINTMVCCPCSSYSPAHPS